MKELILVGNPNAGKTTLLNSLTNANGHTGNWHGVTVEVEGAKYVHNGETYKIYDLPGIYSLTPLSFEEEVATEYIFSNLDKPIINIVDGNNLYRNLYLSLELIRLGAKILLVINKSGKADNRIDINKLQQLWGIEMVEINASNKKQMQKLKEKIETFCKNCKNKNNKKIDFKNPLISQKIRQIQHLIKNNCENIPVSLDFLSVKCLEGDEKIINKLNLNKTQEIQITNIKNGINISDIAKDNYEQIDELLDKLKIDWKNKVYGKNKLDKFVLNKWLSLPIFLAVLLVVFYLTFFSVGAFLSGSISAFIQKVFGPWLLKIVAGATDSVIIYDFFSSAIIGGVGTVLSFLPQIVILYTALGILEESGYLSRVAFSLDDIFSKVGLSGKSVYTLLMGFGCSTTACLTARTMENKNSQIKTAILTPYMSCTAKLPIYTTIGSAFFGASNVFVIFGMYLLGVVIALLLSVFYEKTFLKSQSQSFILEFPPYRMASVKKLGKIVGSSAKLFLVRIGSLLVSINIIVWVLSSFSFNFSFVSISGGRSMIEVLGSLIAPIFRPLGFGTWGATSALIAGLIAKEIIVSTIAMINGIGADSLDMHQRISKSLTESTSVIFFTPASAISYMVFCLLYSPCLASVATLKREIGGKWTAISVCVQLVLAYLVSLVLYLLVNAIMFFGVGRFLIATMTAIIITFAVISLIKNIKRKKCYGCLNCNKNCKR